MKFKSSLMYSVRTRSSLNESGEAVGFGKLGAFRTYDGGRLLSHDNFRQLLGRPKAAVCFGHFANRPVC